MVSTPPQENFLIVGDLNSHSPSWGYKDLDQKGEDLEDWMTENSLVLINKPDDPPTYYSRSWRTTSTPDLAMGIDDIAKTCTRTIGEQLGGSDHKPCILTLHRNTGSQEKKGKPRWNYTKAKWKDFKEYLEIKCKKLPYQGNNLSKKVDNFTQAVLQSAQNAIPRGFRKNYIHGWDNHLQKLNETVCTTRDIMKQNPTDTNVTAHNKAKAEFTKEKLQVQRNSCQEKTQSLNLEKDTNKLWQLTKILNGDVQERSLTVLEHNGELVTGKRAANTLAKMYRKDSETNLPRERIREARAELKNPQKYSGKQACMTSAIRMDELEEAIKQLKNKKSPGPDSVSNDMIKHFGEKAKSTLLRLFNESWRQGKVPSSWKKAHIIPIHKKGKSKKDPESYRPISLISCLGKLMERILNKRLIWYLESNNILAPCQTGYRSHRSTEGQLMLISQEMENAFQKKEKVVSVFFDLSKAFDKVWKEGLLQKMSQLGIRSNMFKWTKSFLQDRSANVLLDGHKIVSMKIREGVPQGGVISPVLFLIYINDITQVISPHVSNTLHADDLAVWSASEHISTATYRIQQTVKQIQKWTEHWGLKLN